MAGERIFLRRLLTGLEATEMAPLVDLIRVAWLQADLPRSPEEGNTLAAQQVAIALDIIESRVSVESEALAALQRRWPEGYLFEGEEDASRALPQTSLRTPWEQWNSELRERLNAARSEYASSETSDDDG